MLSYLIKLHYFMMGTYSLDTMQKNAIPWLTLSLIR